MEHSRLRIAIFTETFLPKTDGITTCVCHLLRHLEKRGHQALVFAPQGAPAQYASAPVIGLSSFQFPLYPELRLVRPPFGNVERELAAFKPDIIHLVNPALLGWVGLYYGNTMRVPVVASYHTDIPGYAAEYGYPLLEQPLWAYFRWIHNCADLNLCPSRFTRNELLQHGFKRVRIWGHGVDMARYHPKHRSAAWRAHLSDGEPEKPLLIYVGRLAPEKRVDWLCPVIKALPKARLAIVGDGPSRPELEAQLAGTPTVFTGYLRGQDLAAAYASGDLFVFPSASETFGVVVLEAMSSGLPVVAPRAGGPVDHVIDGHNGYLFAHDSVHDLVRITRDLVERPAAISQLGVTARAYAESQSWESILDGLLVDYDSVITAPRTRHYLPLPSYAWRQGVRSWFRRAS